MSARTRSQESTYLWDLLVLWTPSASCQLSFSQVQGAAGVAQRGTVLCRHCATLGSQLSWPCCHSSTLGDIRGSNQRNEASYLDFLCVRILKRREKTPPSMAVCLGLFEGICRLSKPGIAGLFTRVNQIQVQFFKNCWIITIIITSKTIQR